MEKKWETDMKISNKRKMAKNHFSRADSIPEVSFWGFWGLVCIEKRS